MISERVGSLVFRFAGVAVRFYHGIRPFVLSVHAPMIQGLLALRGSVVACFLRSVRHCIRFVLSARISAGIPFTACFPYGVVINVASVFQAVF